MAAKAAVPGFDEKYMTAMQEVIDNWDSIKEPEINLAALRKFIIDKIPFYAHALQMVDIVFERDDDKYLEEYKKAAAGEGNAPPMGYTNGFRIYLRPKLFAVMGEIDKKLGKPWFSTPVLGVSFVILHEIGHIVFDSFGRVKHRNFRLWNTATDYQINQFVVRIMREAHIFKSDASYTAFLDVVNRNFLLDPVKYEKMSSEENYDDLYKAKLDPQIHAGSSCFGDMKQEDGKGLTENEKMIRDIINSELKDYARKNAGKLPGNGSGFREFQFLTEPPKVDLRQVLKQITDRMPREDWGYGSRANRMDHLLPDKRMRLPTLMPAEPDLVRKVMFILDSSGSMSDDQINDAINIVRECLNKHTKNPIHLIIHTDSIVHSAPLEDEASWPRGYSGGTAFQPVLEEISRLKKKEHIVPSVVIWLTDLYGELQPADYNARNFPFHKILRWIISGSNLEPTIGKYYHIDQI